MIAHAMKYVGMAERVRRDERWPFNERNARIRQDLRTAERRLHFAERALVDAYGDWRKAMEHATDAGSTRAAEYLERTTWDLT
jgi:hypothetical protein